MATIIGTNGDDLIYGSQADDQIYGLDGNDELRGRFGANNLFGGAGDDILDNTYGTSGGFISTLEGGTGADQIRGAYQWADYASYAGSSAAVTVNMTTLTASGGDAQGDVLNAFIDGVIGSAFNDVLTGNAGVFDSDLKGGAGNDILTLGTGGGTMQGGAGADTLIGGMVSSIGSNDVLYTNSSSSVTVNLATGTGSGGDAEGDVLQNIDQVFASAHDDVLIGGSEDHRFFGRDGNDLFRGGVGAEFFAGDAGQDTADYSQSAARIVTDMAASGTVGDAQGDSYQSIEILRGTNFNDSLSGDAGANELEGGAGADVLNGRDGIDTASYVHSAAGVTVSLATGFASGGAAQGDTLTGFENLRGSAFADTLVGDTGSNVLEGGAGADTFYGGAGLDTVSYAHSAAGVRVSLSSGSYGSDAWGDTFNSIENLIGSDHDDVLRAGPVASTLSGGAGNDILRASISDPGDILADIFDGGSGFDMVEYAGTGISFAFVDLRLGTGLVGAQDDFFISIEGLTGTTVEDRLLGNDADNIFYGMEGNDTLSGREGADILSGGAGTDQLDGGAGSDIASYYTSFLGVAVNLTTSTASGGDAQGDTLTGIEGLSGSNLAKDILAGDAGANVLRGWGGDDALTGAGGKDTLIGGAGADRFICGSVSDSAVGAGADVIRDFSHAQGDRIDLSAIDASTGTVGNQAFTFIGTALYTGVAGQLRYHSDGAVTTIAGDVDGDGVSDFHIQLTGSIGVVAGDFVL
jgi:Ca2+-binding RTX toxin-like protein